MAGPPSPEKLEPAPPLPPPVPAILVMSLPDFTSRTTPPPKQRDLRMNQQQPRCYAANESWIELTHSASIDLPDRPIAAMNKFPAGRLQRRRLETRSLGGRPSGQPSAGPTLLLIKF